MGAEAIYFVFQMNCIISSDNNVEPAQIGSVRIIIHFIDNASVELRYPGELSCKRELAGKRRVPKIRSNINKKITSLLAALKIPAS
jgi:hypothetical protein